MDRLPDCFVDFRQAQRLLRRLSGTSVTEADWQRVMNSFLLPRYWFQERAVALRHDVEELSSVFNCLSSTQASADGDLFGKPDLRTLPLFGTLRLELTASSEEIPPAVYAAARNLIKKFAQGSPLIRTREMHSIPYFPPTRIVTVAPEAVTEFAGVQLERYTTIENARSSQFANSAYYMGSKRLLASFLVESLSSFLAADGVVLDLMCGSGAASGAFCRMWKTYSSDAQAFCRYLAKVQGGGFSPVAAGRVLKSLQPDIETHMNALRGQLKNYLQQEEDIFFGTSVQQTLAAYRSFVDRFPLFPHSTETEGWDPVCEVNKRTSGNKTFPYCLFTSYFTNVYFGLRQSIEIDSIRYAIDQLESNLAREWALGALITTVSACGTTYAGHFAQPPFRNSGDLSDANIFRVIRKRSASIIHEFSVRLLNLAEESERAAFEVEAVPGPWQDALALLHSRETSRNVVVYVDAPYKREEYSRYYHVLETLVRYSYPASTGLGRVPDKESGDRFTSEFFTRSHSRMRDTYARIIKSVLENGWCCAWSYSDAGQVSAVEIIDSVLSDISAKVTSFSTPYMHRSQGGRTSKRVTEFLIVFQPE